MKKYLRLNFILITMTILLAACQPRSGDFVPLPQENTIVESYYEKKNVVQVYDDEQILLKVRGQWDVRFGASTFFIELTNKSKNDLIIEPTDAAFDTDLNEEIIPSKFSYTITGNQPTGNLGNQQLKENKLSGGKIKVESGERVELDTGFYLNIKEFSKPQTNFLGKEVRFGIPILNGQNKKVYKFAFKYADYQ